MKKISKATTGVDNGLTRRYEVIEKGKKVYKNVKNAKEVLYFLLGLGFEVLEKINKKKIKEFKLLKQRKEVNKIWQREK